MTLFDPGFRELLLAVVRQVRRPRGRSDEGERARRRRLSSSGTFTGHRAYSDGEDLRTLDWNVYARTGDLFVKVLEEEQRRALNLLIDTSPSMLAGDPSRFDGARRLAALFGGVALARLDGLNIVSSAGDVCSLEGVAALDALLEHLDALVTGGEDATAPVREWAARGLRGRVVWISDFASTTEAEGGLRSLGRTRREALGLLPAVAEDEVPPVDGYVTLRDLETEETVRVRVDAQLRAQMERELRLLRRRQDAVFRKAGVPLIRQRIPAHDDQHVESWTGGGWPAWI